MKIFRINVLIVILLNIFLFERCVSDTIDMDEISDNSDREYSLDVPGLTVQGSVLDIIDELDVDTLIEADEDGMLSFYYDMDYSYDCSSVMDFSDISGEYSFALASSISSFVGGQSVENSETIQLLDDDEIRLDTLLLTDGSFSLDFDFSDGLIDSVIIQIPELYTDNEIYVDTLVGYKLTNTYTVDLSGSYFDFTKGQTQNSLDVVLKVVLSQDVSSASSQYFNVSYSAADLAFDKAYGNFGNKIIADEEQKISFDAFDSEYLGTSLELKKMKVKVVGESTIGIPLLANIGDVVLTDTVSGESVTSTTDDGELTIDAYEEGGSTVPTDSVDLEITDLGDMMPNQISTSVLVKANQDDETEVGFISNSSGVDTKIRLTIPLWFKTSAYARQDTINFDYNEDIDSGDSISGKISELAVNFDIENGLPFGVTLQVDMVDEDYNVVDSLFESEDDMPTIESATLNSDGSLAESTKSSFSIAVEGDDLELWGEKDVKYLILKISGATGTGGDDDYVKVSEDNYINATLSFSVTGKIDE